MEETYRGTAVRVAGSAIAALFVAVFVGAWIDESLGLRPGATAGGIVFCLILGILGWAIYASQKRRPRATVEDPLNPDELERLAVKRVAEDEWLHGTHDLPDIGGSSDGGD